MTVHHSHRSWRQEQEREHSYANRAGDGGEIMRACQAYAAKVKAERDAQVRHPASIPCTTCRRPTPLPELRGGPGRWSCTTCEAHAASPPQPNPGAEAPPMQEDDDMSEATHGGTRRALAPELVEQLYARLDAGEPPTEVALGLGISLASVRKYKLRRDEALQAEPPSSPSPTPPPSPAAPQAPASLPSPAPNALQHEIDELLLDLSEACVDEASVRVEELELALEVWGERLGMLLVEHAITPAEGEDALQATSRTLRQLRQEAAAATALRAELERLRATLAETEGGAADLLSELSRLRAEAQATDPNPWRRAWELRRRLRQASQEERTAEALLGAAREARIEAADELEAIEAALEATP